MRYRFLALFLLLPLIGQGCIGRNNDSNEPVGPAGVYLSPDKGESWQAINILPTPGGTASIGDAAVYRLIEDPHNTNVLYLASRNRGLFFTIDNGKTWQQSPASPLSGSVFIHDLAIHPVDACTLFASIGPILYRSQDCARSWEEVHRDLRGVNYVSLHVRPQSPFAVLAIAENGDLLKSVDNGANWALATRFGSQPARLEGDTFDNSILYLLSRNNGLTRSNDGGETWTMLKDPLEQFSGALEFRTFLQHPTKPGVLYWVSTYGILISQDRGQSWVPMSIINSPGSVNIYAFEINPKNDQEIYYTGTIGQSNQSILYKTIDGSETWSTKKLPSDRVPIALRVHPDNDSWLYIAYTILATSK